MAAQELSFEEIREYFIQNGGTVTNRAAVKHFKRYLTNPADKDDARIKFKKFINEIATIHKEGGETILTLKPKYAVSFESSMNASIPPPLYDPINSVGIPIQSFPPYPDSGSSPLNASGMRQPPPYRPPPPPPSATSPSPSLDTISLSSSIVSMQETGTPQAPPRRKSTDKHRSESDNSMVYEETLDNRLTKEQKGEDVQQGQDNAEGQTISVKERTQKFNRMASVEDELSPRQKKEKTRNSEKGADEDDGASVTSLDQKKCIEWLVTASNGDYQKLAKLASNEPRLVKLKDPFTAYTVLHWAAKRGNENIIKLFAGTYKANVNARTNGGYTPLHIAAQCGQKDAYNLLVTTYRANPEIRDFSGRKPIQYEAAEIHTSTVNTRSEYVERKHGKHERSKHHHSFLRKSRPKTVFNTAIRSPTAHSTFYGSYNTVS